MKLDMYVEEITMVHVQLKETQKKKEKNILVYLQWQSMKCCQ